VTKPPVAPRRDRTIGFVYLLYFLAAVLSLYLSKGIVVAGNPAATAQNILSHEPLFRAGLAANLISIVCYIALTGLFYLLFEPVSKIISLVAAFLSLTGCVVLALSSVFQLAPFVILGSGASPGVFSSEQVQTLALLLLKLQAQAFNVGLVFFAFYCLLIGYLILRSTFLPRFLGVLMLAAGLGWLAYLAPPFAAQLSPYTQILGFVAEASLMLWLLVIGIDAPQGKAASTASAAV